MSLRRLITSYLASEKETGQGILSRVLENITQTLTHHKNKTLQSTIEQHPETRGVLEPLKNSAVIHSSGVSYSLLQSFDEQSQWDDTAKHVWGNLQESYPDAFSTKAEAMTHLGMLANIPGIQGVIEHARARSNEITAKTPG